MCLIFKCEILDKYCYVVVCRPQYLCPLNVSFAHKISVPQVQGRVLFMFKIRWLKVANSVPLVPRWVSCVYHDDNWTNYTTKWNWMQSVSGSRKKTDIQIGPPEFLTSFYDLDLLDNSAGSLLCRANGISSCIRQVVKHICQFWSWLAK